MVSICFIGNTKTGGSFLKMSGSFLQTGGSKTGGSFLKMSGSFITREVSMLKNYKLRKTCFSSAQLGLCMICGKYVEEVYHQQKKHRYSIGWTGKEVKNLFGHEGCLLFDRPEIRKLIS